MEDRFTKYTRLYILIFLSFFCGIIAIALVLAGLYGFFKMIASRPLEIAFQVSIIAIPPAIFCAVYYIFTRRTPKHPSAVVRGISYLVFAVGFITSIAVLVMDMIRYFKEPVHDIYNYTIFSQLFLAGNVAALFIVALMQAFTTAKEEDWMEKRRKKEQGL
ncbi:hypothetical protein [Ferruginibacter sp.]